MDQVKIGKFISDERKAKGYTQKQLSELLGISDKTISKWECGVVLHEIIDKFIITIVPLLFNEECKEVVKDTWKMVYFPDSDKSTVCFFLKS